MLSVRAAEAARAGAAAALIWMGAVSAQTLPSSHSTVASQESATVAAALADARKLIDAGQPRAAIEKLQKLDARANPRVAELLGVAFYHANDPARAMPRMAASRAPICADGSVCRHGTSNCAGPSFMLTGVAGILGLRR